MQWYYHIAWLAIAANLFFLLQAWNSHRFNLFKFGKQRLGNLFRTALIVPCKGIDENFDKNIASFYNQNQDDYLLWFVVEDQSDPAYARLCKLKDDLAADSLASEVRILTAGHSTSCSQKIHNLLHCYRNIPDDVEAIAFADSDACVRKTWLRHIVWPLRQDRYGAASGYRWYVPQRNNLATLALSSMNAKVAQLLGNTPFNQAWGGSMAITVETFRKIGLEEIWSTALSDDLSLSYAVKKAGMKVAYVPACLVASHESTTWLELIEFARRQFLITRIAKPLTWLFGLVSSLFSALALWAGAALAAYASSINAEHILLYAAVPLTSLICQIARAVLRQRMIARMLEEERDRLKPSAISDICLSWLWSLLMLALIISSAFGRTIRWRGIRYKMLGPTQTQRIDKPGD